MWNFSGNNLFENLKIKIVFKVFKIKIIDNECELNVDLNYGRILNMRNLSKHSLKRERNRLFPNISKMYYTSNVSLPTHDMFPYFYTDFYQLYSDSYKSGA
jgi:hypothetical protein